MENVVRMFKEAVSERKSPLDERREDVVAGESPLIGQVGILPCRCNDFVAGLGVCPLPVDTLRAQDAISTDIEDGTDLGENAGRKLLQGSVLVKIFGALEDAPQPLT